MKSLNRLCLRCRAFSASAARARTFADTKRPSTAPKPIIDIKHIRQNPQLYARTCTERNYEKQADHPDRIVAVHSQWQDLQNQGRALRERINELQRVLSDSNTSSDGRTRAQTEARELKQQLSGIERGEADAVDEMQALALELPNLTSEHTPLGDEPLELSYINNDKTQAAGPSHVDIGLELGMLDFSAAASSSGWGWYYLLGDGARLEHALVQYALAVASRYGWTQVIPPSIVYSHIGSACGFQPRDAHGETQVYTLAQSAASASPPLCLAGTSEIPLAAIKCNTTIDSAALPLKLVGVSRCFRAEAGARGSSTRGLYRVHEFTKVELFAWTAPSDAASSDTLDEMLDMQTDILQSLDLSCRVLEMPSSDLGASASRKIDMEAWFPGRGAHGSWGELSSASSCTDYQTRRLATRLRLPDGKLAFPWTVNATALAVPRVMAALLENGWDKASRTVAVPEVLRPWLDGRDRITPPQ